MLPLPTGLLSGLAATVPMTAVMEILHRPLPARPRPPPPPRKITQRLTRRARIEHLFDDDEHQALALTSHFAYGASTGAAYAFLDEHLRPHRRPLRLPRPAPPPPPPQSAPRPPTPRPRRRPRHDLRPPRLGRQLP